MTKEEISKLPTVEQRLEALLDNGFIGVEHSNTYDPNSDEAQIVATLDFVDMTKEEFKALITQKKE